MKKFLAILLAAGMLLSLASCGSSSSSSASYDSAEVSGEYYDSGAISDDYGYSDEAAAGEYADDAAGGSSVYSAADVKLIRTADLSLETKSFVDACAGLEQTVSELGGYLESANVDQGGYDYYGYSRYASYTVRVPAESYDTFINGMEGSDLCSLTNKSESTEDVGLTYGDLETHLDTLKTELSRLNALMEEATEMSDIISLESAISDVEYEINSYSSELNRYDSLINYATIYVYISEVVEYTPTETGFGARLIDALHSAGEGFVQGVQNLIIWLVANCLNLLVFAAVVVLIVFIVRRVRRKRRARRARENAALQTPAAEQKPEE